MAMRVRHLYRINMGNWEHVEIEASIELDGEDHVAIELASAEIEEGLAPILAKAEENTVEDNSFLHQWEIQDA